MRLGRIIAPSRKKLFLALVVFVVLVVVEAPYINESYAGDCVPGEPCVPRYVSVVFMGNHYEVTDKGKEVWYALLALYFLVEALIAYLTGCLLVYIKYDM